ncbi:hypothetical protein HK098_004304 [Nowakowskiella sp. JEL0407]|nr:hypothetical protein HK098_004304 [Nowakowskiella sp. JEL0407]
MNAFVSIRHTVTYRVLKSWADFPITGGLPSLSVVENDVLIIVGTISGSVWGYFYNIRTENFGFLPLLPHILFLVTEEPNRPNFFLGVHPFHRLPLQTPVESPVNLSQPFSGIPTTLTNSMSVESSSSTVGSVKKPSGSSDLSGTMSDRREPSSDRESSSSRSSISGQNPRPVEKLSVTFWKGQQKYCKGTDLTYPEEVFNLMCPMYNYVMTKNPDNILFTNYFESMANENLDQYTEEHEWKVWKVWNNKKVDFVTPYNDFKSQLPSRFTNPLIFEMFLIFNEWEESGKDLSLLVQDMTDSILNNQAAPDNE